MDRSFFIRIVAALSTTFARWPLRFLFASNFGGAYCRKEKAHLAQCRQSSITLVSLFTNPVPSSLNFITFDSPNAIKGNNGILFLDCCNYMALGFIPYHFTVELRASPTHLSCKKRCCELRRFEFFLSFYIVAP